MLGKKGVFLTFMAFLLAGTVIALAVSASTAESKQQENLAIETAFTETNNRFGNIRQQTTTAKEGYAGEAYGRIMPFDRFTAGDNWFEIEQSIPLGEDYLEKTYDAFNLFAVFAEDKGSQGATVEVNSAFQANWDTGTLPEIAYLVMPQCYKFIVGGDYLGINGGVVAFEEGSTTAVPPDPCNFADDSIKSSESAIHLVGWNPENIKELSCDGAFLGVDKKNCRNDGIPQNAGYVKLEVVVDNCPSPCTLINCKDPCQFVDGRAVISANILDYDAKNTVKLSTIAAKNLTIYVLENNVIEIGNNLGAENKLVFIAKVEFFDPIEEIVLASDLYDFSVIKEGFGVCRATQESYCP